MILSQSPFTIFWGRSHLAHWGQYLGLHFGSLKWGLVLSRMVLTKTLRYSWKRLGILLISPRGRGKGSHGSSGIFLPRSFELWTAWTLGKTIRPSPINGLPLILDLFTSALDDVLLLILAILRNFRCFTSCVPFESDLKVIGEDVEHEVLGATFSFERLAPAGSTFTSTGCPLIRIFLGWETSLPFFPLSNARRVSGMWQVFNEKADSSIEVECDAFVASDAVV